MNWREPKVYAIRHKNEDIRANSRSGGIFTALSDKVLENDGVVYGCVLTEKFEAIHIRAENAQDRDKMRGSKYIQSKLGDTFVRIKEDVEIGREVLFSGTSCQVAGLKKFLKIEYENLICIDIVCHGVPSKNIWKEYLKWQQMKYRAKVIAVDFRNKKDFGWRDHVESIYFENGKKVNGRVFKNLFYGHSILRPSCYECKYKSIIHPGDITIADYWGIEKAAPEFDDNKGVSLALVNNNKGEKLLEQIKENIEWKKTKLEDSMQTPLKEPFLKPENREQFWKDFYENSFEYIAKKYGRYGLANKIKAVFRKIKVKLIR
ncbi:Coenzyme F420 hydrogenase/dehydrogenase, beta subunit C-terminal domain [Anaerostipes sp. MSJ-23]|uniref:Coenzyme F420 hydrogenase/dehydrogenase, beta subunit C-terminal domain n=1 Tax=Anaerostipes sp. MSJ-23 TaxID=2841520 RepID=UPI001C1184F9|nr:Coenzyme F420 hydrogenase/dehydrogenase, beta subunit C-terminal domain [Anaerostipes sp. MSJ-23]MBU5461084.1 Coenzyme F420 hydrogenase/dehydrogenase, beta subunit C-terminal domain [Anaerostipes sp. MSJ-23]